MYAGARAYIGTLFTVTNLEAAEVAQRAINFPPDITLAEALWAAQNEVYNEAGGRRPYVVMGTYPQRLRMTPNEGSAYLVRRLAAALEVWNRPDVDKSDGVSIEQVEAVRAYYRKEIAWFRQRWGPKPGRKR